MTQSMQKDIEQLREQLEKAEEHRKKQERTIAEQNSHINEQQAHINQQQVHISSLDDENSKLKEQIKEKLSDKDALQKEVLAASDYIVEVQEKCYESNKQALDLLQNLKDSEEEVETLKNYIIDLKARIAVYVPNKEDPVDIKLAEYINNYPDR